MLSGRFALRHNLRFSFPRITLVCLTILCFLVTSPSAAETKTIIIAGEYTMGEGETMLIAKERAVAVAMRNAVEQAGIYLESLTQVQNMQLTKDEITVIAAGVVEVLDKTFDEPKLQAGSVYFRVTITARVNPDTIDALRQRLKDTSLTADYKKIQRDRARLQTEVEDLKRQLSAAKTEQIKRQIEDRITRNEQVFSAIQWYEIGLQYHNKQELDKAINAYTNAIRLNPRYVYAYNNRGNAYADKANYSQAITEYTQALSLDPQDDIAYFNRAIAYAKKGQYDQAIADYTQAVSIDPRKADAFYGRGNAYVKKRFYDQAIADYTQAASIDPRKAEAYYNKALVCEKAEQTASALAAYRQFLQVAPPQDVQRINYAKQRIAALEG